MRVVHANPLACYPLHWATFDRLCATSGVEGWVLGSPAADLPDVHRQLGWIDIDAPPSSAVHGVERLPTGSRLGLLRGLSRRLGELAPDAILLGPEPVDPFVLDALAVLMLQRKPRVVCTVMGNTFVLPGGWKGPAIRLLWRRIDALAAAATGSVESIRSVGMPDRIPATPLVVGVLPPPARLVPLELGLPGTPALVVGFAGRLVPEKGVLDLVRAASGLPEVAVAVAGDGPLQGDLEQAAAGQLAGRLALLGLLGRDDLWRFLAAVDVVVVPSQGTATWTEQFGYVIAEAMAAGRPVVGSDSGAIPEVIGDAGIVVPEGDSDALANALGRLAASSQLRDDLAARGRERYESCFSIDACAASLAHLLGVDGA